MIEKAATTWAKHEPDFNHLLVCPIMKILRDFRGTLFLF